MSKVIEIKGRFKILHTTHDYVVVNTTLDYENHAHFKSMKNIHHLINLLEKGLKPTSPYMIKAAQRLLGDEFGTLSQKRQKSNYNNQKRQYNRSYI